MSLSHSFLELTRSETGLKVHINPQMIRWMSSVGNGILINFARDDQITVRETISEIRSPPRRVSHEL